VEAVEVGCVTLCITHIGHGGGREVRWGGEPMAEDAEVARRCAVGSAWRWTMARVAGKYLSDVVTRKKE